MLNFNNTRNPVTEKDIIQIEDEYGISFPTELKTHLLAFNGGHPDPSSFEFIENGKLTKSRVHFFYAINSKEYDDIREALTTFKLDEKRMPDLVFPIGEDPFGNVICISVDPERHFKSIFFWNHEQEVDYNASNDNNWSNLYLIARDLESFLRDLKP